VIILPYHSNNNITSKFFIQLPNGIIHELNPHNLTFTMNIGEMPYIHGDFSYGAQYDIVCKNTVPNTAQSTEEWKSEALDEFLNSIKICGEGGGEE
jgi:hypothetical protein